MSSPEFLQETLEANLRFQATVVQELVRIAKRKAENRRQAARLLQHVVATWEQKDELDHSKLVPQNSTNNAKDKWKYDPYRRWTRRFFVDPNGRFPPPNSDVTKRRLLEQQQHALCHTNAATWSSKETKVLQGIVNKMLTTNRTTTGSSSASSSSSETQNTKNILDEINFEEVATLLHDATRKDRKQSSLLVPRSPQECRLQFQHSQKLIPFTKEESLYILEQVHLNENKQPNWSVVASSLQDKYPREPHCRRTAWQCLCHYQTKLISVPSEPWTRQEDELLFWYLAAMGPQFLLDLSSAAHLSSRLLPDKAPKQILARANQTLLNPNVGRDVWSDEDQRKLVLCMKIYSDSPSPLTRAAVSVITTDVLET
jgi:hypothetical protein